MYIIVDLQQLTVLQGNIVVYILQRVLYIAQQHREFATFPSGLDLCQASLYGKTIDYS